MTSTTLSGRFNYASNRLRFMPTKSNQVYHLRSKRLLQLLFF